ncbi:MAG: arsenate reductase (glutaredoxin) [Candidatus Schmidhempelia sp.]|nr:arsenate reductase (glutaredoxin) [Candidatus Schmidhempelia sp.]
MIKPVTIYHNPNCSKSRETLALLREKGIDPLIILYLTTPPSITQLESILQRLSLPSARALMRTKETCYKALNLDNPKLTETELLTILHNNPQLIERPIVMAGEKACIGRPPENVLAIL